MDVPEIIEDLGLVPDLAPLGTVEIHVVRVLIHVHVPAPVIAIDGLQKNQGRNLHALEVVVQGDLQRIPHGPLSKKLALRIKARRSLQNFVNLRPLRIVQLSCYQQFLRHLLVLLIKVPRYQQNQSHCEKKKAVPRTATMHDFQTQILVDTHKIPARTRVPDRVPSLLVQLHARVRVLLVFVLLRTTAKFQILMIFFLKFLLRLVIPSLLNLMQRYGLFPRESTLW